METKNEELITLKQDCLRYIELSGRHVIAIIKGVSRSGMLRNMDFYCIIPLTEEEQQRQKRKARTVYLNSYLAKLLNYPRDKQKGTLKIKGCGMDMAFEVVYNLGRVLYPNGDGKTITGRNGNKNPETDGGYLLSYEKL
jgi:hypothetical protein